MNYNIAMVFIVLSACNAEYDITPVHTVVVCDASGETPACNTDTVLSILNKNFDGSKSMFNATPNSTFNVFLTSGSTDSMRGLYSSEDFPMAYGRNKSAGEEWVNKVSEDIRSLDLNVDDSKNNSDILGGILVASNFIRNREGEKNLYIISDGRQIGGGVNLEKGQGTVESAVKRMESDSYTKFDSAMLCGMVYSGISEKNLVYAKQFWSGISRNISDGNLTIEASCNNI